MLPNLPVLIDMKILENLRKLTYLRNRSTVRGIRWYPFFRHRLHEHKLAEESRWNSLSEEGWKLNKMEYKKKNKKDNSTD